jgi:hypothetical protein
MYEFSTAQDKTLRLEVDERGITFVYVASRGGSKSLERWQSWLSIQELSAKLRNKQRYFSKDASLSIWKQGDQLNVKFYALGTPFEDTLTFSNEAATKILCMFQHLPNLN